MRDLLSINLAYQYEAQYAGELDEHNVQKIEVILPKDISVFSYYKIAFQIGEKTIKTESFLPNKEGYSKEGNIVTLTTSLSNELTQVSPLLFWVECYGGEEEETYRQKSHIVKLIFKGILSNTYKELSSLVAIDAGVFSVSKYSHLPKAGTIAVVHQDEVEVETGITHLKGIYYYDGISWVGVEIPEADLSNIVPYSGAIANLNLGEHDLQTSNIVLPATTADSGQIKIGEHRFIHSYGNECLFIGYDSGNFTMSGGQNSAMGSFSLRSNTTGSHNTGVGAESLFSNRTGNYNSAMGSQSLRSNTTGNNNSAMGYYSLSSNTTGNHNSAMGCFSLYLNTIGSYNTGVGAESLYSNTTGGENSSVGCYSLRANTTGNQNSAMGSFSLYLNTTGSSNTGVGAESLYSNKTGNYNSAIGHFSLYSNTTGEYNSAMGYYSLWSNTDGNENSAMGSYSLYSNTTGGQNSALGSYSLYNNTGGSNNTAMGCLSLLNNIGGSDNTAIGSSSLSYNTTGGQNSAMGYYSLCNNTDGNDNSAMGNYSLYSLQSGDSNIAIGSESGKMCTSIDNSIFIGSSTKPKNNSGDINEIVIGHNTVGNGSNTVTLGHTDIVSTILRGNVKIGTKLTDSTGINAADTVTMAKTDSSTKIATTQFVKNVLEDFEVPEGGSITVNEVAPISGNITLDTSNIEPTGDRWYSTSADIDLLFALRGENDGASFPPASFILSGLGNEITGDNSAIVAGRFNFVDGWYSATIGGAGNLVSATCSATIGGEGLIASADYSAIVGKYGETPADSRFAVANGTDENNKNIAFYVGGDGVSHFDEMPEVPAGRVINADNQLVDKKYVDENAGSTSLTELIGSELSVGNFYKTVDTSISFTLPTADTSKSNLIMLDLEVVGNISIGFGTTYATNMSVPLMVAGNYLVSWEYSNIVSDWVVTVLPYGVIV